MQFVEFPPDNKQDFGECYWYLLFLVLHFKSTTHQNIQEVYKKEVFYSPGIVTAKSILCYSETTFIYILSQDKCIVLLTLFYNFPFLHY